MRRWMSRLAAVSVTVATVVLASCSQSATEPRQAGALLEAQEVLSYRTSGSGYTHPRRIVVADPASWAAEWSQIHANTQPVPPLPEIDFAASVVVIAAMGVRGSGGHEVIIEQVRARDGALFVEVRERSPGSSCLVTGALTSPVHVVQVLRQGTTASFTIRRETYSC
jgi:hypothetical protein